MSKVSRAERQADLKSRQQSEKELPLCNNASKRASAGQTLVAQQMLAMAHGSLPAEIDLFPLAFVKKGEGQACPHSG